MGKPTICIGENKGADQLRGNCEADQRLCFRYSDSTIPLLFKLLACFCSCTGWFVSDLFGNHIVGFPTRRLISRLLTLLEFPESQVDYILESVSYGEFILYSGQSVCLQEASLV